MVKSPVSRIALVFSLFLAWPLTATAQVEHEWAHAVDGPLPTISIDEIQRGQTGYGLSVFAGTEPERFELEVLGVMKNTSPDTSYILARLSGHGLEESGVIAGMSGSPVFIDDRLAGAVAFSWSFSRDAIAGITPIAGMRRLNELPPRVPAAAGAPPVALADLLAGRIPADLLERQLSLLAPPTTAGAAPSIQWATAGFGESSLEVLRRGLGPVAPAGQMSSPAPAELAPGSAVAAVLVDGDLRLAATGTVTDRDGDAVLAFGHPFLGMGPIRLPMASSEVITVISNQLTSFKLANVGSRLGAFEQDRLLGIQGRLGAEAPMVPMVVRVGGPEGAGSETPVAEYRMEVADLPALTPILLAVSSFGGLEAASYLSGRQGIDFTARFRLAGHEDVEFSQSFDGDSAAVSAVGYLLGLAGYLLGNELEQVKLEEVEVEFRQWDRPRTLSLVGAHANRTVVRPGQTVTLNLDLLPYRGQPVRRTVEVEIPSDVPRGTYHLFVGDGASVDAARLAVEPAEPVSFPQALRLLRSLHSRRELVVLGVFAGRGLAVAGEVMPRLPGSIASLWSAASSDSASPLRLAVARQQAESLDVPVSGLVRIDLDVRRKEPLGKGEVGGGAPLDPDGEPSPAADPAGEPEPAAQGGAPDPSNR